MSKVDRNRSFTEHSLQIEHYIYTVLKNGSLREVGNVRHGSKVHGIVPFQMYILFQLDLVSFGTSPTASTGVLVIYC
jgi:hypothetical protein